jgi:hypothetical protein
LSSRYALLAAVGYDARVFNKGRALAARIGLVPREHSSGERDRLLGISKCGDVYLRNLLIHGAYAVLRRTEPKENRRSRWDTALKGTPAYQNCHRRHCQQDRAGRLRGDDHGQTLRSRHRRHSQRMSPDQGRTATSNDTRDGSMMAQSTNHHELRRANLTVTAWKVSPASPRTCSSQEPAVPRLSE